MTAVAPGKVQPHVPDQALLPATPKIEQLGCCSAANRRYPELVAFDKVTKCFEQDGQSRVAIENVSFCVRDIPNVGELVTIVGPSGCGKSTLLRIIAGLEPHFPVTSGEVRVFGQPAGAANADRGLVDQKYSLLPNLTILDNVAFGLMLRGMGKKERQAMSIEWIKKVGLEKSETKYPSELSGGQQQRVSIAATLILKPKILLMDEPFGALDPKIRLQMQELLVQLWVEQQGTVFFVTHSVDEAVYLGDRVYRMSARPGRFVEEVAVPRPTVPPEVMRKEKWFQDICQELLWRLETDAPAKGALPDFPAEYKMS